MRLKTASMMLFWFGILAQSITILIVSSEYFEYGYSAYLQGYEEKDYLVSNEVMKFAYYGFIHCAHIVAGYLLAKGKKQGILWGIGVCAVEIIGAFSPSSFQYVQTLGWIGIRIFFVIVLLLIISGRKELVRLKTENWRPWKNPFASQTN